MNILKLGFQKITHRKELKVLELCLKSAREYAEESYEEPILLNMTLYRKFIIDLFEKFTVRYKVELMDACLKVARYISERLGLEEFYSDEIKQIRQLGYNNFLDSRLDFAKIAAIAGYSEKRIRSMLQPIWKYPPENRDSYKEMREIRRLLGCGY